MDDDNEQAQAKQRDAPGGEVAQRSWTSLLANDANEVAVGGAIMALGYGAKLAADKIRKPPPPPPPLSADVAEAQVMAIQAVAAALERLAEAVENLAGQSSA